MLHTHKYGRATCLLRPALLTLKPAAAITNKTLAIVALAQQFSHV